MAISVSEIPKEVEMAIEKMPPISPIIGKVNQIAHEIETSPKELVKIIMLDPVLTGKVIKLVNSSFYGVAERVQSLPQAVILLGVNTVKNLAVSTALLGTISVKKKSLRWIWKNSGNIVLLQLWAVSFSEKPLMFPMRRWADILWQGCFMT